MSVFASNTNKGPMSASSAYAETQDRSQGAGSSKSSTKKVLLASLPCWIALVALLWITFGRTLGSYFLADDFGEVAYASMITHGRWDLFWLNWTGNYMQIPSMAVYRPWLMLTLVTDQLLWGANAFGYYLTNLLYVTGDVLLIFGICKELASGWNLWRRLLFSFSAAALFAVSPLHCESTSWVVGRVDTACCFFYLSSLLLFIKSRRMHGKALQLPMVIVSCALFVIAMLVKEMAIGLPVLVTAIALLFPVGPGSFSPSSSTRNRIQKALVQSAPFWAATVIYFAVRYATLGTLLGGYTGGIGDAQASSALANWLQLDIYRRVAFPLPYSIYGLSSQFGQALALAYTAALTMIALRALTKQIDWKTAGFVVLWIATTLAPIYKLWALGLDLEGSRFLFFLTVPLSILLPLLLLSPPREPQKNSFNADVANLVISLVVLSTIAAVNIHSAISADKVWVKAGREVRACQQEAVRLVKGLRPNEHAIVLGIPKNMMAAHMIYNGDTLNTLLRPPFVDKDYSKRLFTFDPILFGPSEFINSSRFHRLLNQSKTHSAYVWQRQSKTFVKLNFNRQEALTSTAPASNDTMSLPIPATKAQSAQVYSAGHAEVSPSSTGGIAFKSIASGDGLRFSNLSVNPLDFDYLELQVRQPNQAENPQPLQFRASWQGAAPTNDPDANLAVAEVKLPRSPSPAAPGTAGGSPAPATVLIPLSSYWRWFAQGKINDLFVTLPTNANTLEISAARLISAKSIRPQLLPLSGHDDGTGVIVVSRNGKLSYDCSKIPGATQVEVQSTAPNYFLDQNSDQDTTKGIYVSYKIQAVTGLLGASEDLVPAGGFSQVRCRALDAAGTPLGQWSDPLTLLIR